MEKNLNLNFKRVDIQAYTMKEAEIALADQAGFENFKNATQAWKNAGSPLSTSIEFKKFCAEYLQANTKNKQGLGCVVVLENGSADTRERPYKETDVVNESGKRKYKTTYLICDEKTGVIMGKSQETKAKAKAIAKDLYKKDGYRGDLVCTYTKEVVEGEPVAFKMSYAASKSAKNGHFVFFGVEKN